MLACPVENFVAGETPATVGRGAGQGRASGPAVALTTVLFLNGQSVSRVRFVQNFCRPTLVPLPDSHLILHTFVKCSSDKFALVCCYCFQKIRTCALFGVRLH